MQWSGTREVFISHATEDKPLAEALGELIELGLGLSHDQIFCSSLAGQGIPSGTDFKSHIKGGLARAHGPLVWADGMASGSRESNILITTRCFSTSSCSNRVATWSSLAESSFLPDRA
jgi:hypothetical protein